MAEHADDLVKLLFLDSVLSRRTEKEWAKSYYDGTFDDADNFDTRNAKLSTSFDLISNLAEKIHIPKNSSFRESKSERLQKSLSSAKYWLDSSEYLINNKMSYCNLRREAELIMSSRFMDSVTHPFDLKNCPIRIFWDFENCSLPTTTKFDVEDTFKNIKKGLGKLGYHGDIEIIGYGNTQVFSQKQLNSLRRQGINIVHVVGAIHGAKDVADKKLIVEMSKWADKWAKCNEKGIILLLTGDVDFRCALADLKMVGFHVLLAHNGKANLKLKAVPHRVFLWSRLIQGKA